MKTLFTICIALFSFGLYAQDLFAVTGKIQLVSYYQGGPQLPPEMMTPKPLPNTKLYVVQYFGPNEKTKIVSSITSNKNGDYMVKLPPGKYGFVEYKTELGRGIYLPGMIEPNNKKDTILPIEVVLGEVSHQDYWALSTIIPFEVTNQDLTDVDITHYDITICSMCP